MIIVKCGCDGHERILVAPTRPGDCYDTQLLCQEGTELCADSGKCVLDGKDCWRCQCDSGWGGFACQYQDWSVPFWLTLGALLPVLGTTLGAVLMIVRLGASATGNGNSVVHRKRE